MAYNQFALVSLGLPLGSSSEDPAGGREAPAQISLGRYITDPIRNRSHLAQGVRRIEGSACRHVPS